MDHLSLQLPFTLFYAAIGIYRYSKAETPLKKRFAQTTMDIIYPLSCCDDTYTNMRFSLLIGLEFDHPLCPQTLEASLYKLLTADENWLKLTGRLRRNKVSVYKYENSL